MTNSEPTPEAVDSFEIAVVDGEGMVLYGYRPDGTTFVNPDWPLSPIREVSNAWIVEGPQPAYHRAAQAKLRAEWPTLADALDRLAGMVQP